MSNTRSPKKSLTTRQAAQVLLVQVMQVLPLVEDGKQTEVVDMITLELELLPLKRKDKKSA